MKVETNAKAGGAMLSNRSEAFLVGRRVGRQARQVLSLRPPDPATGVSCQLVGTGGR